MEQNLNQYKIFYTVARIGSISHAANELYISQPAVSKAISRLEESLDCILLKRNSRGVNLTDAGKVLFDKLDVAFKAISSAEDRLKRINELGIGHVQIGASATLCKFVLLPYLKDFVSRCPHIKTTIVCQSSTAVLRMLRDSKLDVALVVKPNDIRDLDFYTIGDIEDAFVATEGYLNNFLQREDAAQTAGEYERALYQNANLMLLDKDNISRQFVDAYFNANGIEPEHILEVSTMDLLIEFAKISLGIACVIKQFVQKELDNKTLIEIPMAKPFDKRSIGFAVRKGVEISAATQSFLQTVAKREIKRNN